MTLPIEFSAEAEEEFDAAVVWFDEQRPGFRSEFSEAIDVAVRLIAEWPRSGSIIEEHSWGPRASASARLALRLGYLVLDDRVQVLAVAHDHRKPGYWHPRAGR